MNDRFYIDKLTYEVGETVLYFGERHKIVYIHEDGLVNLEDGKGYIYGCHMNMFYKIKVSETNGIFKVRTMFMAAFAKPLLPAGRLISRNLN